MKQDRILTVDADELQMVRKESGDGGYDEKGGSFWFNALPEDMEIGFLRTFSIHDSNENVVVYDALRASDLSAETRVMNNPEEFRYVNGECGEIADETIMTEAPYRYYSVFIANHGRLTDLLGSGTTSTGKCDGNGIWVCADRKPGNDSELVFNYGRALAYETLEGGAPYFFPIFSFPMTFDEKGVHANAFISDRMMGEVELMTPEGGVDFFLDKPLCAHPRFSWMSETGDIPKFGNSIPALVAGSVWQSGFRFSMMHLFYLGRHGENRECDLHSGWSEVTVDGENVFQGGIGELIDWTKTEFSLPKANGRYEFVIDNDCAMVDGKVGVNHTVIYCDASAEDREAPTLTMLNFRDREDNVTDRFDNPDDCILEFSAADMSSEINDANLEWLSIGVPSSVKVEYAAEDSDNFKELPCEEVPELFYAPCFGAFYRVSFADADQPSATGWFKLRITLEDAMGNRQQQTISPVVYIDGLASVTDVYYEAQIGRDGEIFRADAPLSLYDMEGRLVRNGERELSVSGLRGAYIVRSGAKTVKVIL